MTARRRRVEGGRREHLHADAEGAVRPRARGLAKPSGFPPVIMPERLAKLPTTAPLTEVIGSGPFIFKRDEWVPGNKACSCKNPHYVGAQRAAERPLGQQDAALRPRRMALPARLQQLDRRAEERRGRHDRAGAARLHHSACAATRTSSVGTGGVVAGLLVINQLFPPFNNPKVRQAVLKAVNQEKFVAAHGLPARHAHHLLRHVVHLRRPQPDRGRRRAVPQARPRQGEAAARRGRLQGREGRRAGADRHHLPQRRGARDGADAEVASA